MKGFSRLVKSESLSVRTLWIVAVVFGVSLTLFQVSGIDISVSLQKGQGQGVELSSVKFRHFCRQIDLYTFKRL